MLCDSWIHREGLSRQKVTVSVSAMIELWRSMGRSQSIQITAPLDARVEFLLEDYKHLMADPNDLILF